MDPARERRAKAIFVAALERPAEERATYVRRSCEGDEALAVEVARLLVHDGEASRLGPPPSLPPDARFDGFRVVGRLGEGGMGVVYDAVQDRPNRRVALKVVQPWFLSPRLARYFDAEVEILARLEHPGIARLYAAGHGETPWGPMPYFAMERIDGGTLLEHAAGLGRRKRYELLLQVADAVAYAHRRGVVHRDLKPANVLVDREGRPKVVDFGVARSVAPMDAKSGDTRPGLPVGTPSYTSPEQAAGAGPDQRSDVYSLGVLAFELFAGRKPLELGDLSDDEALSRLRTDVPPRLGSIDPALRGDVEWIVAKCLEKAPERRYESAVELADDLRRHLSGEPVRAHPPSTAYQLARFASRHRVVVSALLAVLLGLSGGLAVALSENAEKRAQILVAETARIDAERAEAERARSEREALDLLEANALTWFERGSWRAAVASARKALERGAGDETGLRQVLARAHLAQGDPDLAREELTLLERAGPPSALTSLLRGDLAVMVEGDLDAGRASLRSAIEAGLPDADDAYARALLAETTAEALDHLRRSLSSNPFHFRAARMAPVLRVFVDDGEDALVQLREACRIRPRDGTLRLAAALGTALAGDLDEAQRLVSELDPELAEADRETLTTLFDLAASFARDPELEHGTFDDGPIARAVGRLAGRPLPALATESVHPLVRECIGHSLRGFVAATEGRRDEALSELGAAYDVSGDGVFPYLQALSLTGGNETRETVACLRRALASRTIFPGTKRRSQELLIPNLLYLGGDDRSGPEWSEAMDLIREWARTGPVSTEVGLWYTNYAWQADETELAYFVLHELERAGTDDPRILWARTRLDLTSGRLASCLRNVRTLLERAPGDERALAIQAACLERLRAASREAE